MANPVSVLGQKFGQLTVIWECPTVSGKRRSVRCKCTCGNTGDFQLGNLKNGHTTSCGCIGKCVRHMLSSHPLYSRWKGIKHRTTNSKCKDYHNYGGRGIRLCSQWLDVRAFISYVEVNLGPQPSPQHSLDRRDNNGDYAPGNLRWATRSEQERNKRCSTK